MHKTNCHFFMRKPSGKFEMQFTCLRENTEKCIYSVLIEKKVFKMKEITKTMPYKF